MPGLYAPGASVPPLRLRDLRRVCRACDQSRHPFLLQSLRLHSVTQAPSAGPAHTFEGCCRSTFIRLSVPEPERPPSLASSVHTVRLLPRLSACLLTLRKTERTMLTHSPFRLPTSRAEDMRTLQGQCVVERHHTPGAMRMNIFTYRFIPRFRSIGKARYRKAIGSTSLAYVFRLFILKP